MDLSLLVRSIIIGFSIAAPVGPIGVLCIRRTLADGRLAGFVTGLGAATADAIYGCIAGFGLTLISGFLISYSVWVRFLGGLFLCYLGVTTFFARPAKHAAAVKSTHLVSVYTSALLLTLTNPVTILAFAAIFAGLGMGTSGTNYASALVIVGGVFTGSSLWWLLLTSGASIIRTRLTSHTLGWINRVSGLIIFIFGILALVSLLWTST